jgi:hypothetical protein
MGALALNPCENLNRSVDAKIGELEQKGVLLKSQIRAFKDTLASYAEAPSTDEALNAAIAGATVDDTDAGQTAIGNIRNFTGTCLDRVYNEARIATTNMDAFIRDSVDDLTSIVALPEANLLSPLRSVREALGVAGLSELLADIDSALGCLAERSELDECLGSLDNFNDRVDDVLSYLGLGENGELDLENFVDHFDIGLDDSTLSNLDGLDQHMEVIKGDALANIKETIPSTVNPFNKF